MSTIPIITLGDSPYEPQPKPTKRLAVICSSKGRNLFGTKRKVGEETQPMVSRKRAHASEQYYKEVEAKETKQCKEEEEEKNESPTREESPLTPERSSSSSPCHSSPTYSPKMPSGQKYVPITPRRNRTPSPDAFGSPDFFVFESPTFSIMGHSNDDYMALVTPARDSPDSDIYEVVSPTYTPRTPTDKDNMVTPVRNRSPSLSPSPKRYAAEDYNRSRWGCRY